MIGGGEGSVHAQREGLQGRKRTEETLWEQARFLGTPRHSIPSGVSDSGQQLCSALSPQSFQGLHVKDVLKSLWHTLGAWEGLPNPGEENSERIISVSLCVSLSYTHTPRVGVGGGSVCVSGRLLEVRQCRSRIASDRIGFDS